MDAITKLIAASHPATVACVCAGGVLGAIGGEFFFTQRDQAESSENQNTENEREEVVSLSGRRLERSELKAFETFCKSVTPWSK